MNKLNNPIKNYKKKYKKSKILVKINKIVFDKDFKDVEIANFEKNQSK
jgi:hypothetical protein